MNSQANADALRSALRWLAVLVSGATVSAVPLTVYVDVNAAPGGTGGTSDPFRTIGAAVTAINGNATVGHGEGTVLVADGTYRSTLSGGLESLGTDGITLTKYMTIKGGYAGSGNWTDASRVPRSTNIDLTGAGTRAFYQNVPTHLYTASLIDGFALRNANHGLNGGAVGMAGGWGVGLSLNNCLFENNVTTGAGGGAYVSATDGPSLITNCDFVRNRASGDGGGLRFDPSYNRPLALSDCRFIGNQAASGGGVLFSLGSNSGTQFVATRNLFSGNSATVNGGAVFSVDGASTSLTLSQSRFLANSAPNGAAIGGSGYWVGDYVVQNCLVAGNTGGFAVMQNGWRTDSYSIDMLYSTIVDNPGGGVSATWLDHAGPGPDLGLRVRDSIVAYNGSTGITYSQGTGPASIIQYSDVWGQAANFAGNAVAGTGTISADPQFADRPNGIYDLLATSPARDTAFDLGVYLDLVGKVRPYPIGLTPGYDMGAFEFPEPTALSLAFLAGAWFLRRRRAAA